MHLRHKLAIIVALVTLGLGSIAWFIIIPTLRDIQQITSSIQEQRNEIEEKYQRGQLLRKLMDDFKKIGPDKDRLATAMIAPGGELDFIITLEQLASRHDVDFDPQRQSPAPPGTFPLQLSLRGSFIQLMQYLQDIERLPTYFNVRNLEITSDTGGKVQAIVIGEAYLQESPTSPAAQP